VVHPEADGVLASLNSWINSRELFTTLSIAAVTGLIGWAIGLPRRRRRLGVNVLYDEPINQGDPVARRGQDDAPLSPNMWEIEYRDADNPAEPYPVTNGSLVVIEMRNIGWQPISEAAFGRSGEFTLRFPGRNVVHFKVRDNPTYHKLVHQGRPAPAPGAGDSFTLPALQMNRNDSFKLLVLLESPTAGPAAGDGRVRVEGSILGGKFVEYHRRPRRRRNMAITAAAVLLVGVVGVVGGVKIANRALTPSPACARGKLDIDGSTAFAPVFNEVATEYEQDCPGAQITVQGVGSIQGLADLERNTSSTPIIAMYDGVPLQPPDAQFVSRPVGVIIFAIVGNRSLPPNLFAQGTGGGLTDQQIVQAFQDPHLGGLDLIPVGRSSVSGTREAFVHDVLNGNDSSEQGAGPCPSKSGVCLEDTTMDLLTYINGTPNAIGYAEADALPFFPNVGVIPINGYEPTRANALDGNYTFLATEHLYTDDVPTGLAADLINFLTSKVVTAQLRDTSFIGCSDLGGSKLSAACSGVDSQGVENAAEPGHPVLKLVH
jgi:phosphate transport system substrate-binding protein